VTDRFFEQPILVSPYHEPAQHWELDPSGQPTGRIVNVGHDRLLTSACGNDAQLADTLRNTSTGDIRSDNADGIACWFVDTDYNEESFFVRHAYFLGANDPYKNLKTTLKAEIDEEAWQTLNRDTSRPFDKPKSGRVAVKVINHLGDEAMRVFRV
jgi:adenine-specific DNA-methyltransferase